MSLRMSGMGIMQIILPNRKNSIDPCAFHLTVETGDLLCALRMSLPDRLKDPGYVFRATAGWKMWSSSPIPQS